MIAEYRRKNIDEAESGNGAVPDEEASPKRKTAKGKRKTPAKKASKAAPKGGKKPKVRRNVKT